MNLNADIDLKYRFHYNNKKHETKGIPIFQLCKILIICLTFAFDLGKLLFQPNIIRFVYELQIYNNLWLDAISLINGQS